MRIKSIHINGFGTVRDYTLADLSPGINVIEGRNEAGKTTLMSFIRSVLFGFASRNRSSIYDRYEPVNGGRHGGAITLIDDNGHQLIVERVPGPAGGKVSVYVEDGRTEGEAYLHRLLGGISPALFRSLFAFSLTELQQLEFIEGDEVSDYIYSAGMGAAVTRAEKWLDDRMLGLYRKNGQAPAINSLLRQIKSVDAEIARLKNLMLAYNKYTAEIEALDAWIANEEKQNADVRARIARFETLEKAGNTYGSLQIVRAELLELPDIHFFPEDGVRRLESLLTERRSLEVTLRNLETKQDKLSKELESLPVNSKLLEAQPSIEALLEEAGRCEDRRQAILENEVRMQQHHTELDKKMRQLGSMWTQEALLEFDLSLPRREEVRECRDRLNALEQRAREARQEHDRLEREVVKQEAESKALSQSLPPNADALARDISRKETALSEARQLYNRMEGFSREQDAFAERIADLEEEADRLTAWGAQQTNSMPPWLSLAFLCLGLVLSAFVWHKYPSAGVSVAAVVVILSGILYFMQQKANQPSGPTESVRTQHAHIKDKIQGLQARQSKAGEEYREASLLLEEKRRILGTNTISYPVMQRLEAELASKRGELDNQSRLSDKISESKKKGLDLTLQLQTVRRSLLHADEEIANHRVRWQGWLTARNLAPELSPEGALDMFAVIEACRDIVQQIRSLEEVNGTHRVKTDEYAAQVKELYERAGLAAPVPLDAVYAIRELKKAAVESRSAHIKYEGLKQDDKENTDALTACRDCLTTLIQDIDDLLRRGGCTEEEQFRIRARQHSIRQQKLEELRTHTHALQLLLGFDANLEALEGELLAAQAPGALQLYEEHKSSLEQSLHRINEWRDKRGALRQQLAVLEKEGTLSDRLQDYEEILEELKEKMREWSVYAACRSMLKQSREKYEQERQPGVIRNATRFFSQITEGKYTAVLAPLGEKRILVQKHDGQRIEPGYLSRGTKEQLYLAMRFALAGEYASQCTLPLIMDDIFVNFDGQRLRSTLKALQTVAQTHQILLFTCHPHVTNSLPGEHKVIRIGEQLPV